VAVSNPANIKKAKKAIAKAFKHQLKKTGFSLVEILSACPTNWRMSSIESCRWIDEVMAKEFPLGVIKEVKC
jgi:2-oxoglutarate ferredoxin oxidoreductase subunit beta